MSFLDDFLVKLKGKNQARREKIRLDEKIETERIFGTNPIDINTKSNDCNLSIDTYDKNSQIETNKLNNDNAQYLIEEITPLTIEKILEDLGLDYLLAMSDHEFDLWVEKWLAEGVSTSDIYNMREMRETTAEELNELRTEPHPKLEINWAECLQFIKSRLIFLGYNSTQKRKNWFSRITGYEGKLKNAPIELFERVYCYLASLDLDTQLTSKTLKLLACDVARVTSKNEELKTLKEIKEIKEVEYLLVTNDEELKEVITALENEQVLAIDTETTGLDPHIHKIRLIQIASHNQPTIIIDCFKCDARLIQPILANSSIKIFHNAKFDLQFFFALGLEVNQVLFDTMLAYQLINLGKDNINSSLKAITKQYLNIELNKDEQLSDWVSDTLSDSQLEYAKNDVKVLLPLRDKLKQIIKNLDLVKIAKIEFDCIHAIAMMEFNGMLLYVANWENILKDTIIKQQNLARELKTKLTLPSEVNTLFEIKSELNLDSPKQLLEALHYHGINVKDTNSKTLKKLATNPIIKLLLEYKKLTKIISSFGESLLKKINPLTGRLHGTYWQLGSQSGRLTSSNPNLQQIPRNKETRSCFIAQPEYKLVIADYSQIELRIAAEIANDKTMIKAYNKGEDLHKLTASIVLNKPLDEVTKEDRQIAKSANFGLIYGSSVNGFRNYAESNYGITLTESEAKKIYDNFFKSYQGLAKWHKLTRSMLYRHNISQTKTLSGRVRIFEDKPSPQQLLNTPVQGLGADMLKLALGKLVSALKGLDCRILATVHDEIILEAHESIADEVAKILSSTMVDAGKEFLKLVPVESEATICDNWAEK